MLVALTTLAVGVHGYHLGADDAGVYLPAVKKVADPLLFPFGAEFFLTHASLSIFSVVVGDSATWAHVPADAAIFAWHVAAVFLLFLASYRLLALCFVSQTARWAGMLTLAGLLTCPVAGTALILMEPYLTARSLSTPVLLFAGVEMLKSKWISASALLVIACLVHPQMGVYSIIFAAVFYFYRSHQRPKSLPTPGILFAVLPFTFDFQPSHGVYREILQTRSYFLVSNWSWAEWLGAIGPLAVLWWFSYAAQRNVTPLFPVVCRALVVGGALFTTAAIVMAIPPQFQSFARLQPMRAFHLIYIVFFLFTGAAAGEYLLKRATWRWVLLFGPMMIAMFAVQVQTFPASPHIEFPVNRSTNPWVASFFWIRTNTPINAVFALDPDYLKRPDEDIHSFRAIAERSMVADNLKDSGTAAIFPQLAGVWKAQVDSLRGWRQFKRVDFERLHNLYGVTWIVWQGTRPDGFTCPFSNRDVQVCQLSSLAAR